jgi:hypothetical protein
VQLKAKTAEFRGRLTHGETLANVQAGTSAALTAIVELHRFIREFLAQRCDIATCAFSFLSFFSFFQ